MVASEFIGNIEVQNLICLHYQEKYDNMHISFSGRNRRREVNNMGLLNSLIRKAVSTVVDSAVDSVMKNVPGKDSSGARSSATAKRGAGDEYCRGESDLRGRIESIVAEEWPGYELRKNVSGREMLAQNGASEFYSYGIYHDGVPVAMIMLLRDNNAYRRREIRLAQQACEEQKIPYMNFMMYMANYRSYISERLKKNIKG